MNERNSEYVAMIPAGGWRVAYKSPDGTERSEPVIGWALTRGGCGEAVLSDGTAVIVADDHPSTEFRIYHPDAKGESA
jgi:hypothetical protein